MSASHRTTRVGYLISLVPLAILLLFWFIIPYLGVPSFEVPSLMAEAQSVYAMMASGRMELDIGATLGRTFAAILIGIPSGLLVGWLVGTKKIAYRLAMPPLFLLSTAPPIVFFSIMLVVLGLGNPTYIAAGATGAFFPMFLNTTSAVRAVKPELLRVAKDYGASESQILRKVIINDVLPALAAGARISFVLGFIVVVDAELILVSPNAPGLGFLIANGTLLLSSVDVYGGLVGLAITGSIVLLLSEYIEKILVPWKR